MTEAEAPPLDLERALRDFQQDFALYARSCLKIRTKDAGIARLDLNRSQRMVHERISRQRREQGRVRAVILKARQQGVSTYVAGRFYRAVTMRPGIESLVVADERKRSEKLFEIYDRYNRELPPALKPKQRFATKGKHLVFDDPSGGGLSSQVGVETAKDAEVGRASTIQLLHLSELAFWTTPDAAWTSLMQAVPDEDSEIVVESTANGVGGLFYELWNEAEADPDSGWVAIFLPWWIHEEYSVPVGEAEVRHIDETLDEFEREALDAGILFEGKHHVLAHSQLAWRRRTIKEKLAGDARKFRQEYPATPREAFLVSGNPFFDEDALIRYEEVTRSPVRGNIVQHLGGVAFRPAERGYLRAWERPREDGVYVIWADTASGRRVAARGVDVDFEGGGSDFSSAYVYDVSTRSYVANLHGRIAPEIFAQMLYDLGFFYSSRSSTVDRLSYQPALVAVERNHSSGETVIRILKDDLAYPNLFYHRTINRRTNKPTVLAGWVTNVETRQPMLDEFSALIRQDEIAIWDADLVRECWTFVRGEDGKPQAQDGCHDDRVMSAAGAVAISRYATGPSSGVPDLYKPGEGATGA